MCQLYLKFFLLLLIFLYFASRHKQLHARLNFYFSAFHVWWRDDLNWWRVGGGEITSPGGEMVRGESSWCRDDRKPKPKRPLIYS